MPVQMVSPELERIVSPDEQHEVLSAGHAPEESPEQDSRSVGIFPNPEGPVWIREGGYLLFSDIGHNRRMKWSPQEGVSVFQEPTNYANGLTRDPKGRLVACEQGLRRVTRIDSDGEVTVVAGSYRGKKLNKPNDVVVKSDGSVYFTDPGAPAPGLDLDTAGVYRVAPDLADISMVIDLGSPNGLAFSPDESVLYLIHSRNRQVRAFDVQPNGMLSLVSDRVAFELKDGPPGVFDGMKVDVEGNLYLAGPGGIWIVDPSGKHLGTIWIKEPPLSGARRILPWEEQIFNLGWGGDDWKTLFYTGLSTMGRIQMKIPGVSVPPGS